MKKREMKKKDKDHSFQDQKLELIRLRIKNGYYKSNNVLESVVKEILKNEIRK
jgi:anti-sigma28 factor (negative regulator of flagellin synthesis)